MLDNLLQYGFRKIITWQWLYGMQWEKSSVHKHQCVVLPRMLSNQVVTSSKSGARKREVLLPGIFNTVSRPGWFVFSNVSDLDAKVQGLQPGRSHSFSVPSSSSTNQLCIILTNIQVWSKSSHRLVFPCEVTAAVMVLHSLPPDTSTHLIRRVSAGVWLPSGACNRQRLLLRGLIGLQGDDGLSRQCSFPGARKKRWRQFNL